MWAQPCVSGWLFVSPDPRLPRLSVSPQVGALREALAASGAQAEASAREAAAAGEALREARANAERETGALNAKVRVTLSV